MALLYMEKKMMKLKMPRPYTRLGKFLAAKRKEAGLTQREVSIALDYSSAQFISNFERGIAVPPLSKLKILVRMYKLNASVVIEIVLDAERDRMRKALGVK